MLSAVKFASLVPWDYDLDLEIFGSAQQLEDIWHLHRPMLKEAGANLQWRRSTDAAAVLVIVIGSIEVDLYVAQQRNTLAHSTTSTN